MGICFIVSSGPLPLGKTSVHPGKSRRWGRRRYILELAVEAIHREAAPPGKSRRRGRRRYILELAVEAIYREAAPPGKSRRRGRRRYTRPRHKKSTARTPPVHPASPPGKSRRRGRRRYILELSVATTHRNGETPLQLSVGRHGDGGDAAGTSANRRRGRRRYIRPRR